MISFHKYKLDHKLLTCRGGGENVCNPTPKWKQAKKLLLLQRKIFPFVLYATHYHCVASHQIMTGECGSLANVLGYEAITWSTQCRNAEKVNWQVYIKLTDTKPQYYTAKHETCASSWVCTIHWCQTMHSRSTYNQCSFICIKITSDSAWQKTMKTITVKIYLTFGEVENRPDDYGLIKTLVITWKHFNTLFNDKTINAMWWQTNEK